MTEITQRPVYLYTVTMKMSDGTLEKYILEGTDDEHAREEAGYMCAGECVAVEQGEISCWQ